MHLAVKLQHVYARHLGFSDTVSIDALCDSPYEPNVGEIINLVRELLEAKHQVDIANTPNGVTTAHGVAADLSPPDTIVDHRLQEVDPQAGVRPAETVGVGKKGSRRLAMLSPAETIAGAANWIYGSLKPSTGAGGTGMPFSNQGDEGKQERQGETEGTKGEENTTQDEYSADYDIYPYYESWDDDTIIWTRSDDGHMISGRGDQSSRDAHLDNAGERQPEEATTQEKVVSKSRSTDDGEDDFGLMRGYEYTTDDYDVSVLRRTSWSERTEEGENKGRNNSPLPDNFETGPETIDPEINRASAQDGGMVHTEEGALPTEHGGRIHWDQQRDPHGERSVDDDGIFFFRADRTPTEMKAELQPDDEGLLYREPSIDQHMEREPRPSGRTTFGSGGHGPPDQPRKEGDAEEEEPDVWDADDDFYMHIVRQSREVRKENLRGSGPDERLQQKGRERDVKAEEDEDPDVWDFDDDFYIHIARQWMIERKENRVPEVPAAAAGGEEMHEESWTWDPLSTDVEDDFSFYEDPALNAPNNEVQQEQLAAMNVGGSAGVAINPETDDVDEYSLYAIGGFETPQGGQAVPVGETYNDETPKEPSSRGDKRNRHMTSTSDGYSGGLQDDDDDPVLEEWRQERQAEAVAAAAAAAAAAAPIAVEEETDDDWSSSFIDDDLGLGRAHWLDIVRGWNDRLVDQEGPQQQLAGERWSSFSEFYPNDPFEHSDESEAYYAWEQYNSIRKQQDGVDAAVPDVGKEKGGDEEDLQLDSSPDTYKRIAHDQHEVAVGSAGDKVGGGQNDQREHGGMERTPPRDTDSEYFTHLTEMQRFSVMTEDRRFTGVEHQLHQASPETQHRMESVPVAGEQSGEALEQQETKRRTHLGKTSLVGGVALKLLEALLPRNVLAGLQDDNKDDDHDEEKHETQQDSRTVDGDNLRIGNGGVGVIDTFRAPPGVVQVARKLRGGSSGRVSTEEK
ncbi:unnamed protein product [Ectocarpus fasciculatus]